MIFSLITIGFFVLFGLAAADLEASERRRRLFSENHTDLDHQRLLMERIIVGGAYFAGLMLVTLWEPCYLLLIPSGWAAFTIAHRLNFNRTCAFGPFYLAVGNTYDRFYLRQVDLIYASRSSTHLYNYMNIPRYRARVLVAGTLAYALEGFIGGLGVVLTLAAL